MFKLAWIFLRIRAMNDLQYRLNFIMQCFQSLIDVGTGLIGLTLVFRHASTLAGWSQAELLIVMGVYLIMGGLISALIQANMQQLMHDIWQGTLDHVLTRPVDAQLVVSLRQVRIWSAADIVAGTGVLLFGVGHIQSRIGLAEALIFAAVLLMGALMIYCFWLILTTGAFWVIRMDNIVELFQGVYQAGRWPITIYPGWLQRTLTFLVPVAFAVTIPAQALTGRLSLPTLLETIVLTVVLLFVSRLFWKLGLRHYSGASA